MKMFPRLKYQSETENESIITRSRFRSEKGLPPVDEADQERAQRPSHTE